MNIFGTYIYLSPNFYQNILQNAPFKKNYLGSMPPKPPSKHFAARSPPKLKKSCPPGKTCIRPCISPDVKYCYQQPHHIADFYTIFNAVMKNVS